MTSTVLFHTMTDDDDKGVVITLHMVVLTTIANSNAKRGVRVIYLGNCAFLLL